MGDEIKNKKELVFGLLILIFISFSYTYMAGIYFCEYINESDVVKIHFAMFFIFFIPVLIYFSVIIVMMLINIDVVISNKNIFKKIFKVLVCIAALSFVFVVIGPIYMDDNLISKGYIKCQKTSFRSSTIYVVDASLCKK